MSKNNGKNIKMAYWNDKKVIASKYLSNALGLSQIETMRGYRKHKKEFAAGKHFFCLEGNDRKEFIFENDLDLSLKVGKIFCFTELGVIKIIKNLGYSELWDIYEDVIYPCFREFLGRKLHEITWYDRNFKTICDLSKKNNCEVKEIVKEVIYSIMQKYDLKMAERKYKRATGKTLAYTTILFDYYPEMGKDADEILKKLEMEGKGD